MYQDIHIPRAKWSPVSRGLVGQRLECVEVEELLNGRELPRNLDLKKVVGVYYNSLGSFEHKNTTVNAK